MHYVEDNESFVFSLDTYYKGSAIKNKLHTIEMKDALGFNTVFVLH